MRKVSAGIVVVGVLAFGIAAPAIAADTTPPNGGMMVLDAIGAQIAANVRNIVGVILGLLSGACFVMAGAEAAEMMTRRYLASLSPRERAWTIHKMDQAEARRKRRRRR